MVRAYSSAIIFSIALLCSYCPESLGQTANFRGRVDAAKAVLADFERQKELIVKQEELLKQNAKDFETIEKEMRAVFNASEMTMFSRAVSQVARNEAAANTQSPDVMQQGLATIAIMKSNLELMQLSSTQMALAQRRIECLQSANQLTQTRNSLKTGLNDFQEKLWEFADVSGIYDDDENKAILTAFNSVKNEDLPPVLIRGLLRMRVGETDLARDDFDLLVEQKAPCVLTAFAARARIFEKQKETKRAKNDYSIAKKMGDNDLYVQWILGNFEAADGDWKAAENYFQKALKAKKFEQPLHRSLALVMFERNRARKSAMKECLEHAEVASKLGTGKDWLAETIYAAALNETGDSASAKNHLDTAIAECPQKAKKGCEDIANAIEKKTKIDTSVFWKN